LQQVPQDATQAVDVFEQMLFGTILRLLYSSNNVMEPEGERRSEICVSIQVNGMVLTRSALKKVGQHILQRSGVSAP
jgi:hypothetical protein